MLNYLSLAIPFVSLWSVYKQTQNKFLLVKQGPLPQVINKCDAEYEKILKTQSGHRIKEEMQPFLEKENIRNDLIVIEKSNLGFCEASGNNLTTKGDAVIVLEPGFYDIDKEACQWVLKHELSHIKNNDSLAIPLIETVCTSTAAFFGMSKMHWIPATICTLSTHLAVKALFSRFTEERADNFAIENSSTEELLGGRRCLKAFKELNMRESEGFFDAHPSLTSRIDKIEIALKNRGVVINELKENRKIENLKIFILDNPKMQNGIEIIK